MRVTSHPLRWLFYWIKVMDLLLTTDDDVEVAMAVDPKTEVKSWDMKLDINGNIAVCDETYSIAQQAATEIKLFEGEGWYDRSQGTPHFAQILGINSNLGLIRNILLGRVNGVDNVMRSDIDMYVDSSRVLHGNIFITSQSGETVNVVY